MRLKPLMLSAALSAALGACAVTPEGDLITMFDPPEYPDYMAEADAIGRYIMYRAVMRDLQCQAAGDCAPTLNVNVR